VIAEGTFVGRTIEDLSDEELAEFIAGDARYQRGIAYQWPGSVGPPTYGDWAPYWRARYELERRKAPEQRRPLSLQILPTDSAQQIARKLANYAYRHASHQHHPDHGGDHEVMTRINRARDLLFRASAS
jgi:hypothetical protein